MLPIEDLARAAGLHISLLEKLVEYGVIEPVLDIPSPLLFPASAIDRLRCVMRLRRDLGVNLAGAAVIVEMGERPRSLRVKVGAAAQAREALTDRAFEDPTCFPSGDTIPRRNVPLMTWTLILVNCIVFLFEIGLPPDALERLFYFFGIVPALQSPGLGGVGRAAG